MKNREYPTLAFFASAFLLLLLFALIRINKLQDRVAVLEKAPKTVLYHVDNAGGVMNELGKITDKQVIKGYYTVTVGVYGKFIVTEEQYNSISIGDNVPDYLKQRGG